jgi:hypothetical protein
MLTNNADASVTTMPVGTAKNKQLGIRKLPDNASNLKGTHLESYYYILRLAPEPSYS